MKEKQVKLEKHHTCVVCNLSDIHVEAGGLWYCPNVTCEGPGGSTHRRKMITYEENIDGTHSVDDKDWINYAKAFLIENDVEPHVKETILKGIKRLEVRVASEKFGI